ncbi:MAG: 50S ribosomal protein L21 [Candidatus Omnitrophica bacterium]|nr:50S ribosomal protein L21 [Candidatus Omnitrophota bacterium]
MYAIIEIGGKQYKVEKGEIIDAGCAQESKGKDFIIDQVLLFKEGNKIHIGRPYLAGATVKASIVKGVKAPKVVSYKYRRRKSSDWKKGHRQKLLRIKIEEIKLTD